jgi:hypothetical protein
LEKRPHEDFIKLQNDAIVGDKWVIEGNYNKTMPGRFFRADTIIKTEMNRFGCVWRFIRRNYPKKNDARTRIGKPNNMPYNLNWSAIWWIIQPKILYPGRRSKINLQKELFKKHKDKLITLRSFAEINNLCPVAHTKLRPHIHPE